MSAVESKEVFISYSTKDSEQAQYLCNLLEGAGISCWIARVISLLVNRGQRALSMDFVIVGS